jgi:hypothetical protein
VEADFQARNVVAEAPAPEAEAILPLAGRDALELPDGVGAAAIVRVGPQDTEGFGKQLR